MGVYADGTEWIVGEDVDGDLILMPAGEVVPRRAAGDVCPITLEPMRDPVCAADGHTYEHEAIADWLRHSRRSPMTNIHLPHTKLVANPSPSHIDQLIDQANVTWEDDDEMKAMAAEINQEVRRAMA